MSLISDDILLFSYFSIHPKLIKRAFFTDLWDRYTHRVQCNVGVGCYTNTFGLGFANHLWIPVQYFSMNITIRECHLWLMTCCLFMYHVYNIPYTFKTIVYFAMTVIRHSWHHHDDDVTASIQQWIHLDKCWLLLELNARNLEVILWPSWLVLLYRYNRCNIYHSHHNC